MTISEKYQADLEYNYCHPIFAPRDDIDFGKRFTGRFQRESYDDKFGIFVQTIFDNGHRYLYSLSNRTLYEGDSLPQDVFLHKFIEKAIFDTIIQHSAEYMPAIFCCKNEIVADRNPVVAIRVLVNREEKIVRITNILMQIQHKGYGKQLIKDIYQICKRTGYKLWLTEVTTGFYYSLVKRGAKIIETRDVLEITDTTKL